MNILYVVPYVPNKIRIRPYNLVRFLAARGNRVTLLTLWSNELEQESIRQLQGDGIRVIAYPLPVWRSLLNSMIGLFSGDPIQSFYCWQPQLARRLAELAFSSGEEFDAVHIEHLRGSRFGQYLRKRQGETSEQAGKCPPIIWDSVDCISYLFQQAAQSSQKITSRLMTRFELPRTQGYEARMAQSFDQTLVTSRLDQNAFAELLPRDARQVTILPNGVDLDYFTPVPEEERSPDTLVISGKMSYHANVSMVNYLMEHIMPLVWAEKPGVKLWIVGKDPPQPVRALSAHKGVTVTGYVPDLRPYLQKAAVALAPLTYGAGIQNKVLEAMACATPVVATPRAVSALAVKPGAELIVEQAPEAFARQVLKLLEDPVYARQIGAAGRRYVETSHNWSNIAGQLESIYASASHAR